ncbi:hypothetical protein JW949_04545 [Candidatus Woesearchaeota archaeon]|nr:hypothetical protein [Candidatus Woesearchaeota archaeon]
MSPGQEDILNNVSQMKKQGYSNDQIIKFLQDRGYNSQQIFNVLNDFDVNSKNNLQPDEQFTSPLGEQNTDIPKPSSFPVPHPRQNLYPNSTSNSPTTEELVESIIDEKWNEIVEDINKIIDWKNKTEERIAELNQKFEDLKDGFDKLHNSILGKVKEYDSHIQEVGSEVKAMEKVFSRVLPSFTDNVNKLEKISSSISKKSSKKGAKKK